ncbi:MAG: hypothetical protein K6E22_11095 [Treponema sp.]|nr:hypothetical protein [Treponema sp.]
MKKFTLIFFALFSIILQSCNFGLEDISSSSSSGGTPPSVHPKSKWTFIVYMAADNNLDSAALEDFREIENARCNNELVKTLVLFDRASSNNENEKSWSGTKLFEIDHSSAHSKSIQLSHKPQEGDYLSSEELNMGDMETLISILNFSRKYYPADHYGLIIWGHGTGYRFNKRSTNRAIAIDDTSGTFMTIPDLRKAIQTGMGSDKLEFIGFDTCFGAELEEIYELKHEAHWFAGVEGVQDASGWDYSSWMDQELEKCTQGNEVAKLIEKQYSAKNDKSFAIVNMDAVPDLFEAFNSFTKKAAQLINDEKNATKLKEKIMTEAKTYSVSGTLLNPVYIEISSMASIFLEDYPKLLNDFLRLNAALKKVTSETYCSAQEIFPIGIYFCSCNEKGQIAEQTSSYYMQGSGADGLCQFVQDASGYIPTANQEGSLLDKLLSNYKFSL